MAYCTDQSWKFTYRKYWNGPSDIYTHGKFWISLTKVDDSV